MTFTWKELPDQPRYRDPDVNFRLNIMERFFAVDHGFGLNNLDNLWWIALIEIADSPEGVERLTINDLVRLADEAGLAEHLVVPSEYTTAERSDPDNVFVTILARRPYLNAANLVDFAEHQLAVQAVTLGTLLDLEPNSNPQPDDDDDDDQKIIEVGDGTVVTAIIDSGLAIGHDLFRSANAQGIPNSSRIGFFWNMDGKGNGGATIGRKWRKKQIDKRIQKNLHAGLLDEQTFYEQLGLIDWSRNHFTPCAQRLSHGTHVMGLFTGYEPDAAEGDHRPIIAVQLPTPNVSNTSGKDLIEPLVTALNFIRHRHARYRIQGSGDKPPLVLNFSFGNYAGPHDGTSVVERALDHAMASFVPPHLARTALLPVGNSNLKRCHARFNLTPQIPSKTVDWQIQPEDFTYSWVQFWFEKNIALEDDSVTLTVTPPAGTTPQVINCKPDQPDIYLVDQSGQEIGLLAYRKPEAPTHRGVFELYAVPTASRGDARPFAPTGPWRLTLTKGPGNTSMEIKAWVKRDDTLPGFPQFGRQSHFTDPGYKRFQTGAIAASGFDKTVITETLSYDPAETGPVRRAGTISGFACGDDPAVIAGFVRSDRRMAKYSSSGPTNNPHRSGPDAAAVSDDTPVLRGVLSAGSHSGSRLAMGGTSVATPQVARWVAGKMAVDQPSDRTAVFNQAMSDDPPPSPPKPPEIRTGGGRMNLPNIFGKLR